MKFFLAIIALFLGTTVQAQLPYTLNLADGTTTVASPQPRRYQPCVVELLRQRRQLYKNLVAQDNFGFENTLTQQIWALTKSGSNDHLLPTPINMPSIRSTSGPVPR